MATMPVPVFLPARSNCGVDEKSDQPMLQSSCLHKISGHGRRAYYDDTTGCTELVPYLICENNNNLRAKEKSVSSRRASARASTLQETGNWCIHFTWFVLFRLTGTMRSEHATKLLDAAKKLSYVADFFLPCNVPEKHSKIPVL